MVTTFRFPFLLSPPPFFLFQETSIILLDGFRGRVVRSKGLFIDGDSALQEWLGLLVLALAVVECCQVVETSSYIGMLGSQRFLPDGQGLLVEWLRPLFTFPGGGEVCPG